MPDRDPWEGTSGLRDDFDGTIVSARFTYDSEYNNGNTLIARLEIEPDDGGEPEVLKLSTGSGWEDDEKGKKAKREDGKDPSGFNKSCNYYRFSAAALETDFAEIARKSKPWEAEVWEGHNFHFNRREFEAFDKDSKKPEVVVPTVYNGEGKGAEKPARKATSSSGGGDAKAKAAAAKAKAEAAKAKSSDGGEDPNVTILKNLAAECESHDEFIEKAYAALEDADSYESQIVDDAFYNENHG